MRRAISVERAVLLILIVMQAASIVYLIRMSAIDRDEKATLLGRIERYENAGRTDSSALSATEPGSAVAGISQDPALPLFRAHAEMETILASMFGAGEDDLMQSGPSRSRIDRLQEQTLRMFERSFEEFRRAGESMGPRGQMGLLVISPAMDMREFDDCYLVAISLPRFSEPDLSVTLDGQMLCVSGTQTGRPGEEWQFEKRVRLPGPVVVQSVRGVLTNGVLRIVAPKGAETASDHKPARIM